MSTSENVTIESRDGSELVFGPVESVRGNTGDYTSVENKG
jgi:hypothetical protein